MLLLAINSQEASQFTSTTMSLSTHRSFREEKNTLVSSLTHLTPTLKLCLKEVLQSDEKKSVLLSISKEASAMSLHKSPLTLWISLHQVPSKSQLSTKTESTTAYSIISHQIRAQRKLRRQQFRRNQEHSHQQQKLSHKTPTLLTGQLTRLSRYRTEVQLECSTRPSLSKHQIFHQSESSQTLSQSEGHLSLPPSLDTISEDTAKELV